MEIVQPKPGITVFVRPQEGANSSLIRTREGVVVIDTTSCPADMRSLLDAAEVMPDQVRLVINTHQHSDHTWGNQLFDRPILAHRLCREAMAANLEHAWRLDKIRAEIARREESDPEWSTEMKRKTAGLEITLPTETFDRDRTLEIGGVEIRVIHFGGHTPGSAVVWLPEAQTLWTGDLLFVGRYPFIGDADVPDLLAALRRLTCFDVEVIVPGHGPLCDGAAVSAMYDYVHGTWSRTIDHLAEGHSVEEAVSDTGYPQYAPGAAERYHETNIRVMYEQLMGSDACPL
jgi:cyclase